MEDKEIMKTGTTTIAIVCKDGVLLCADKRVTSGHLLANKKFKKIANVSDRIALTTAGTVSDVQLIIKYIKAEIKLKDIRTGRDTSVKEASNLTANLVYNNIRKLSAIPGISHFIMGGADDTGTYVYDIGADGSIIPIDDFVASGSGSVMAYGVLETLYQKHISVDEGIKIGVKAINAAAQRDIASGNGIDIIKITKDGTEEVMSKEIFYKIE